MACCIFFLNFAFNLLSLALCKRPAALCEVSILVATCEFQALFYTITAFLKGSQEHLIPVMAYKETGSTFC